MPEPKCEYSNTRINRAARAVSQKSCTGAEFDCELNIVNEFRADHSFPLQILYVGLRRRSQEVYKSALVAKRLKRLPSIVAKLERLPNMSLTTMQDIGGCRAILLNTQQVYRLLDIYKTSRTMHIRKSIDDYIAKPRPSGYRSAHIVYKYNSQANTHYNNLKIEIQIRSRLQHTWATAVESVDILTSQDLKSGHGSRQWKRFFALMSSAFARLEGTKKVPYTPSSKSLLVKYIQNHAEKLKVIDRLAGYRISLDTIEQKAKKQDAYVLVDMDFKSKTLNYLTAERKMSVFLRLEYMQKEKEYRNIAHKEIALVSTRTTKDIKRAYPNFFADTTKFVELVEDIINGKLL